MLDYLPADSPAISDIRQVAFMSSNTLLLLVHDTLSLDLGVQTLGGLQGQHNEAVFSANWFNRHALSNNTLLSVLTPVNAETRKGCQSVIASATVTNTLLALRWFRCGSNLSSDTRWMIKGHHVPEEVARPACRECSNSRGLPRPTPCVRVSLPKQSVEQYQVVIGGLHALEEVATQCHETLS